MAGHRYPHLLLLLAVLGLGGGISALPAQDAPDPGVSVLPFDRAVARYRELGQRRAFLFHTRGRELLAATGSLQALDLLLADYAAPARHPEYARYTLATLFRRHFDRPAAIEPLRQFCWKAAHPADTWLSQNVLTLVARQLGAHEVLSELAAGRSVYRQAAAVAALGDALSLQAFTAVEHAAGLLPDAAHPGDRALLIGAMAHAIWQQRGHVRDHVARPGMTAFVRLLEPLRALTPPLRRLVASHLLHVLGGPGPIQDPEHWLTRLAGEPAEAADAADGALVTGVDPSVSVFGLQTASVRCCFLLDVSDSMCTPIDPTARPLLRDSAAKGGDNDLPWDRIDTRFDLAREHLKASLQRLATDQWFSVVTFGTRAENLPATPGLVRASRANVARAVREIDAIRSRRGDDRDAPFGVLRGQTNLHEALRRALSLSARGYVESAAYVDADVLQDGCDSILLVTDGAPSWDEFHAIEANYGDDPVVASAEFAARRGQADLLHYFGPFDDAAWLLEDLQRMNTYRGVHIHCLGIGEANVELLGRIADEHRGMLWTDGAGLRRRPGAVR